MNTLLIVLAAWAAVGVAVAVLWALIGRRLKRRAFPLNEDLLTDEDYDLLRGGLS